MGKKFWVFAFVLLAGFTWMGCSGSKSNVITLRCIGWGDQDEAKILQVAVDQFKQAHPGVEVELDRAPYGEYITKVLTQFSGGLAPDVMCVNAEQMVAFSSKGVLVDLK